MLGGKMQIAMIAFTPIPAVNETLVRNEYHKHFTGPRTALSARLTVVRMLRAGNVAKPLVFDNITFKVADTAKNRPRMKQ